MGARSSSSVRSGGRYSNSNKNASTKNFSQEALYQMMKAVCDKKIDTGAGAGEGIASPE